MTYLLPRRWWPVLWLLMWLSRRIESPLLNAFPPYRWACDRIFWWMERNTPGTANASPNEAEKPAGG